MPSRFSAVMATPGITALSATCAKPRSPRSSKAPTRFSGWSSVDRWSSHDLSTPPVAIGAQPYRRVARVLDRWAQFRVADHPLPRLRPLLSPAGAGLLALPQHRCGTGACLWAGNRRGVYGQPAELDSW